MQKNLMIVAALALALTPALAFGSAPTKQTQSTGTHAHSNQYHDRTPHVHERGTASR